MADESSALSVHEPPNEADYDLIHDAVMETQRGRWFLHEFAKRNRNADTGMLLAAIERIETMLHLQPAIPPAPPPASPLSDMRESLDQARDNLGTVKPDEGDQGKSSGASTDFDIVAISLKAAIAQMRAAIGPMRDTAYAMREEGVADRFSNSIEGCASDLSAGCGELDRAATDIVRLLRDLARRIETLTAGIRDDAPPPVVSPAPAPDVEPMMGVAAEPTAVEIAAAIPPPAEHAIPGFELAYSTDEPAIVLPAPSTEALTLDPLLPASDAGIEASTASRESFELVHAPMALAVEPEPATERLVLAKSPAAVTASITVLPDPDEIAATEADTVRQDRVLEMTAALPLPEFAATPADRPADTAPAAETLTAPISLLPDTITPKPSASTRRHPGDALAPIVALSDEEKIALFT